MTSVVVVLVILFGTATGVLVAGDDLYALHGGPNLWETYTTPEQQVELSDQELRELSTTVRFLDDHSSSVTMISLARGVSTRLGGEERSQASITPSGIATNDPLVYRTKWTEHQLGVTVEGGVPGTIVVADWWLQREINASNKVYSTGMVGVVQGENGTHLSTVRNGASG